MDSLKGHEAVQIGDAPSVSSKWNCFGYRFPRQEVVYFSQIIIIYIVIITCLLNLSFDVGESNLWTALLGSCLGYIMPHPSMNKDNDGSLLHNSAQQ